MLAKLDQGRDRRLSKTYGIGIGHPLIPKSVARKSQEKGPSSESVPVLSALVPFVLGHRGGGSMWG